MHKPELDALNHHWKNDTILTYFLAAMVALRYGKGWAELHRMLKDTYALRRPTLGAHQFQHE
jgi:hypothetical protein